MSIAAHDTTHGGSTTHHGVACTGAPLDVNSLMPEAPRGELKRLAAAMLAAGDSACLKVSDPMSHAAALHHAMRSAQLRFARVGTLDPILSAC